ncbi:hypothetical protein EJ110_NYTH23116 [Nymphaea thermarum]|nr:hypothetical protein EJ110_NYTH23116 [Nymphaea thermarum]
MAEYKTTGVSQRVRFSVDLRPAETTIVSWKKLTRESAKAVQPAAGAEPPAGAHPALESRIAPESLSGDSELKDAMPPQNRFSAVIEKIERLYKGAHSSDEEELDDAPDDDQYDTEDSFIDDTELDEYFQVDKLQTKHSGFFVNRGKLEKTAEPLPSLHHEPKKRRRKDLNKGIGEKEAEQMSRKLVKVGGVRMKTAARNPSLVVNKPSVAPATALVGNDHHRDSKLSLNPPSMTGPPKPKHVDVTITSESSWSAQLPGRDALASHVEVKDGEKQNIGAVLSKESAGKIAGTVEPLDSGHQVFPEKGSSVQVENLSRKYIRDSHELAMTSKIRHKERVARHYDLAGSCYSSGKYPTQKLKVQSMPKEGSGLKPKGTMLERAIRELEKKVAESRPPTMDVQENDPAFQGVKRRLPREVKQKLAKVARLAQSSQGMISDELIYRLMSILGHLVQLKTLKRNLKEMVELGLSAKQEKEDRFQQIKREVTEMIKARVSSFKSKETLGSDDKESLRGKYRIDSVTEDKLYDLCDLYTEGMEEDKGPQMRKLYVELAELWPEGWMDNHAIKEAVGRAKERKKGASNLQNGEKVKRKKFSSVRTEESMRGAGNVVAEPTSFTLSRAMQERPATDNSQGSSLLENQTLPSALNKNVNVSTNAGSLVKLKPDNVKPGIVTSMDDTEEWHRVDVALLKKKPKTKPEIEPGGNTEFSLFNKQVTNSTNAVSNQQKSSSQIIGSQSGGPVKNS